MLGTNLFKILEWAFCTIILVPFLLGRIFELLWPNLVTVHSQTGFPTFLWAAVGTLVFWLIKNEINHYLILMVITTFFLKNDRSFEKNCPFQNFVLASYTQSWNNNQVITKSWVVNYRTHSLAALVVSVSAGFEWVEETGSGDSPWTAWWLLPDTLSEREYMPSRRCPTGNNTACIGCALD